MVVFIMQKFLEKLEVYLLYGLVFVLPLAMLPAFTDPFGIPKLAVLVFGVGLLLITKAVLLILTRKLTYAASNFDMPLLVIVSAYIVSSIFANGNKMEAYFSPGTASVIAAAFILFLLINTLNLTQKNIIKLMLVLSATVAALVYILGAAGVLPGAKLWLAGGATAQIVFLIATLPMCLEFIVSAKDLAKRVFLATAGIIVLASLSMTILSILPGKADAISLPSFETSVSVVFDSLKTSPIFGTGPGNYLSAFNRFRQIGYNSTSLWQVRFTTANSFYLTFITETGLVGLAGLVLLLVAVVKIARKVKVADGHIMSLFAVLVILVFLPASVLVVSVLFILLALSSSSHKNEADFPADIRFVSYTIGVPVVLACLAIFFFGYKAINAEAVFKQSIDSIRSGDGKKTYDLMRAAITLNPYVDRYRASYAQTNMALAQSIASGKDLKDEDRQTISTLIQQAIREGKSTVLLNQTRSGNWELLARIYQAIIPFAQGADQFTIQTYSQAIALDPINPNLRISLGGVYYGLGKFDQAIDVFKLAVAAKPDLANSHYNLSAAYREKGEFDNAIAEMEAVLSLVSKDSPDYKMAQTELENLKKKIPAKPAAESDNLTSPQKVQPSSSIKPPLELPQEATPPASL